MFLYGIALSMDAFAVAVCKGLAIKKPAIKKNVIVALWFGGFQAFMPFLGYCVGKLFSGYIQQVDHWVAFVLLALIGINMLRESMCCEDGEKTGDSLCFKVMLLMAIATSIDALAVGIAFSLEGLSFIRMVATIIVIGVTTFVMSFIGVKIGNVFGTRFKSIAERLGGIILILLGLKTLLDGLGII